MDSKQINGPIVPKLVFIVGVLSSPCKLSEKAFNSFNLGKVLNIIFEKGINSPKGTKCPFLYMPEIFPSGLKQYKALYFLKSENVKAPRSKLDLFFIAISLYKLYTYSFLFKYIGTAVSGHITKSMLGLSSKDLLVKDMYVSKFSLTKFSSILL